MAKRSKNKGGAPYKAIDWKQVDQMLIQGCNGTQVAATLGIHPDTLYLRCEAEKNMGFSAYYQEKRAKGDSYLHQAQYQKALKEKNPTLLIWLGKQRLGQRENDDTKEAIPPQDAIVDRDNENMALKAELAKFREEVANLRADIDNITKARQELPGSDSPL